MIVAVGTAPLRALQGHRAGFATRMIAAVIDGTIVLVLWISGIAGVAFVRFMVRPGKGIRLPHPPSWVTVIGIALLAIALLSTSWATTGRSIGKRVAGLRLFGTDGSAVGWFRAVLRAAAYVVFPAGLFWVLFSARNRSLQDVLFRTSVVYDWGLQSPVSA